MTTSAVSSHRSRYILSPALLAVLILLTGLAAACGDASEDACNDDNDCGSNAWCNIQEGASDGTCRDGARPGSIFNNAPDGIGEDCDGSSDCLGELQCLAADRVCVQLCVPGQGDCGGRECFGLTPDLGYCDYGGPRPEVNNNVEPDNNLQPGESYRYVLLEDLSEDVAAGDTPGADIDGVAIERFGNDVAYATTVEDYDIGGANNAYADPNELLGPPDSGCTKANLTALGGAPNGGWVILGFGDEVIEHGDYIVVYELGPTVCPNQPTWHDDEVAVSISVSSHRNGDWVLLGSTGTGQNVVVVP